MLRPGVEIKKIFVLTGRTDLRRGIDGMVSLIKLRYGLNPIEKGTLFLFCGTKKDRIKGILYEGLSADFCYPHIYSITPLFA